MFEIDFLPVESESGPGSKSGDAIVVRFYSPSENRHVVVIIDAGYAAVGDAVLEHVGTYHGDLDHIDVVISTHPDADHLNGLEKIIDGHQVDELWVHQPRLHRTNIRDFSNLEALDSLLATARRRGVVITEPFTYTNRFSAGLLVLGPTASYYEELLDQHLAEVRGEQSSLSAHHAGGLLSRVLSAAGSALDHVLDHLPLETLTDGGETGPRNNMSVITLISVGEDRLLFTGDAGIPALEAAADAYEEVFGAFAQKPLNFMQIPHHGSRRNVGPTILNRILGAPGAHFASTVAFVSSAKADKKHPSAKVLNAFSRRGAAVNASEGRIIGHHQDGRPRLNWIPIEPIGPLAEDIEDD